MQHCTIAGESQNGITINRNMISQLGALHLVHLVLDKSSTYVYRSDYESCLNVSRPQRYLISYYALLGNTSFETSYIVNPKSLNT